MKKLFLDDYRWPNDCARYMQPRIKERNPIYIDPHWIVVRSYTQFVKHILEQGMPGLISFDHDLADGHYHANMQEGVINYAAECFNTDSEKTGYHAAQWLVNHCMDNSIALPDYIVHSMNPVGTENIQKLLDNFKKHQETNSRPCQ